MNMMDRIAVSATGGDDKKPLDEVLASYSAIGFGRFEAWLHGRGSALDIAMGAPYYRKKIAGYGMGFSSLHMPVLEAADDASINRALEIAHFAEDLGIRTVTFNASTKAVYIKAVRKFLHLLGDCPLTAVIQVHEGRSVSTMKDLEEVLLEVDDPRLKVQLEVGSFHAMGVSWKSVCEKFRGQIGLVHVKDMVGAQSVPLGTGEIDLPALFRTVENDGYDGFYVVELAPKDRENTNRYFVEAYRYLRELFSRTENSRG